MLYSHLVGNGRLSFFISFTSTTSAHDKKIVANKNRSILPVLIAKIIMFCATVALWWLAQVISALVKIVNIIDNITKNKRILSLFEGLGSFNTI